MAFHRIVVSLGLLFAYSTASAVTVTTNFSRDLVIGPTLLLQTPGQTLTSAFGNDGTSAPSVVNCVVPAAGCTGGPGIASLGFTSTIPGISGNGAASAGNDAASSSLSVSSAGSNLALGARVLDVLSGDFQRLRFDVSGATVPATIEVDITFSVSASISDNSNIASDALHFPVAQALVEVLEADTVDFGPPPTVFSPFSVKAFADTDSTDELINGTETFTAKPNTDYWVRVITQSNLTLPVASTSGDFAGLDVTLNAFADPTFALNAEFAALNPELAANLVIDRVQIAPVPVPMALPLLVSGLAVLGYARRRFRR